MTETVTLQWYLKNLSEMLERESPTEVVSHCRYILQRFPQNVETYRLLGKALLQKAHSEEQPSLFDEAAEVFLRVLSVLPGDYIAHLGMSEIREQANALDQAIWHMERAYEQMPGNAMLQEGLRRLYVRRHGGEQAAAKIQLTRGGLARQYMQAHLFEQALTELRDALDQSPQRVDLEVLLAETLWESQHPVDAGEVAVQILKKLPNCLPALKILARLWLDYERPTDAQVYLEQIEALDPYEAVRLVHPGEDLPDGIRLPRLDYSARAAAALSSETPDWVEELGDISDIQDVFQPPASYTPPTPPAAPAPYSGPDRIDTDAIFGMALGNEAVPDWYGGPSAEFPPPDLSQVFPDKPPADRRDQAPRSEELAAPEIPDWFAEVVNAGPTPAPVDTSSVEADWLSFGEDEVPELPTQDERPSSGFTDLLHGIERSQATADEFSARLDDIEPVAPEWLASFDEQAESPLPEPDMMAWLNEEIPEAALSAEPEKSEAADEAFSWDALESLMPTDEVPAGASQAEEPAWLSGPQDEITPNDLEALRQASMPPEDLSDFFGDEEFTLPQEEPGIQENAPGEQETAQDDWLADFQAFDEAEFSAALAGAEIPTEEAPAEEIPAEDWLTGAEAFDEAEFSAALTAGEEIPAEDWLTGVEAFDEEEFSAALAEAEIPTEESAELSGWVESAAPAAQLEEDLLAFFDMEQEAPLTPAEQLMFEAEPESAEKLVWPAPQADEDDWLASYAKPEAAMAQEEQPGFEEFTAEPVPYEEPLSFEAEAEALFGAEYDTEIQEPESPPERIEAAASLEEAEIEAAVLSEIHVPETDEEPAWLSDIEPISAPPLEMAEFDKSYDLFAESSADQAAAYESAKQTGILQPFEEPDWMAAFSGEEMPPELEAEEEPQAALPLEFPGLDYEREESDALDDEQAITDSLAGFELEDWEAPAEDLLEARELVVEEIAAPEEEGVMPDWLVAITSEAEKLDDEFIEESESYGSTQETGVLQPGSKPDWLMDLEPDQEVFGTEPSSAGEDQGAPLEFPAAMPEIDDFFLGEADISDELEAFEFELEAAETSDEVAQPGDLAHTSDVVWETETSEDWEDESVPGDFSFEDVQPAWLRRPKAQNLDGDQTTYGKPPEAPKWLHDIFEDDEQ